MQYIDVVIDNKSAYTDTFFTYSAPDDVEVGARLTVPFAGRHKAVDAYCVSTGVTPSFDVSKVREISSVDTARSLSAEMVETAMWMRRRYGTKYIDGLKMFAAGGKKEPERRSRGGDDIIAPDYELTSAQMNAAERICRAVEERSGKVWNDN